MIYCRPRFLLVLSIFLGSCASNSVSPQRFHTVVVGDDLEKIAEIYGVRADDIAEANGLYDGDLVKVGRNLFIPYNVAKLRGFNDENYLSEPARVATGAPTLQWPLENVVMNAFFGWRGSRMHEGLDLAAGTGTPVFAAGAAKVLMAGSGLRGYGTMIVLAHGDNWTTVYAHLSRIRVRQGQWVQAGSVIGYAGKTGRASAPHLHFEVRHGADPVDPLIYLPQKYANGN